MMIPLRSLAGAIGLFLSHNAFSESLKPTGVLGPMDWVRMVLGLLLVLGVIVLFSWLIKRLQGTRWRGEEGFYQVNSLFLGPKERVILLHVGGRYLLVGSTPGSINLLHDFGDKKPEGLEGVSKTRFSDLLKSQIGTSSS